MPSSKTRAAAVAVSLFALASAAKGTVQCHPSPAIPVPATTAGVYVNLVTGVNATTPAGAPNWDFNPWGSSSINFWLNNSADPAGNPDGNVAASAGGTLLVLSSGATIDATSFYSTETPNATAMAPWRTTQTGKYLGVRFYNETTASTNYGWIQIDTVSPTTGLPATIQSWCYQDDGTGITAGTSPVELETFTVE
ncbi:MAG TPA: hypothetical protein VGS57_15900 [Thermoanaerobaculia bacterium]|jgi:hypothetical protein|nr:hypothetical protein [Thermoanaerobaculia bacterium]